MEKIIYKGILSHNQIEIVNSGVLFSIPSNVKRKAEILWKQEKEKAERKQAALFEAEIYRLERFDFLNEKLFLTLGTLPYSFQKTYKYLIDEIIKENTEYCPNGLFTSTLVKTKDNKYIFGRRENTVSENTIDMIGGTLSKDEGIIENGRDLFDAALRELNEELNVQKENISDMRFIGAFSTGTLKICLLFYVVLNLSADEIESVFKDRIDEEMSSLIFVNKDKLESFLISLGGYKTIIANKFITEIK